MINRNERENLLREIEYHVSKVSFQEREREFVMARVKFARTGLETTRNGGLGGNTPLVEVRGGGATIYEKKSLDFETKENERRPTSEQRNHT